MINWIVSVFETFTMATTQVPRLRKYWIVCLQPIKFEKNMDQPIRAKQAPRQYYGVTSRGSRIALWSFLKNWQIFLRISATITRITKAGGFLCFKNLNGRKVKCEGEQEHIKTEHKDMVDYLQWVISAAPRSKIIWKLILTVYSTSKRTTCLSNL